MRNLNNGRIDPADLEAALADLPPAAPFTPAAAAPSPTQQFQAQLTPEQMAERQAYFAAKQQAARAPAPVAQVPEEVAEREIVWQYGPEWMRRLSEQATDESGQISVQRLAQILGAAGLAANLGYVLKRLGMGEYIGGRNEGRLSNPDQVWP